jgi:hypothetical protein
VVTAQHSRGSLASNTLQSVVDATRLVLSSCAAAGIPKPSDSAAIIPRRFRPIAILPSLRRSFTKYAALQYRASEV